MNSCSSLRFLSRDEMDKIYSLAIRILEEVGVSIENEKALGILSDGGCEIEGNRVRISEEIAKEILAKIAARNSKLFCRRTNREIDFRREHFLGLGTFRPLDLRLGNTGALFVLDPGEMRRRLACLDDVRKTAVISNFLDNVKVLSIPMQPSDCPPLTRGFHALVELMVNSSKPVIFDCLDANLAYSQKSVDYVVRISKLMSGGFEEMEKKPSLGMIHEVISPLKYDSREIDFAFHCISSGINSLTVASMPIMGVTAPLSIPAAIAQSLVEIMPGLYLFYLFDSDIQVVPGLDVIPCEMKTLNHSFGSIETTIVGLAESEFKREYLGFPVWGARSFRSDAKIPGIQAAFEKSSTAVLSLLAGGSGFGSAGVIDGAFLFSYEQLVIDNEIFSGLGQIVEGVEFDEKDFDTQLFRDAMSKSTLFLAEKRTVSKLRVLTRETDLFEKRNYSCWQADNVETVREKAQEKLGEIMKGDRVIYYDKDEIDEIKEIVSEADKELST